MNYFAYGSNMSFKVISSRINKVQFLFVGFLPNHKMLCNKRSLDGSGKANIAYHPCDVTWGVIYKIDSKYMNNLDRIEGGYERKTFRIITSTEDIPADAYISYNLTNALPDLSYKETIINGAVEHQLPPSYIKYLINLPAFNYRKKIPGA